MTDYSPGQTPTFWDPNPSAMTYRFLLGCTTHASLTDPPLVAIGMNPSRADEHASDKTVNRIIEASVDHGFPGWIMLNLYPERETSPGDLSDFDPALSAANCAAIERVIVAYRVSEVLGAWGNPNSTIRLAKADVLATLTRLGVRVFYLDDLTAANEPRHPTPRTGRLPMAGPKRYLT
ncbi:DUF1643 domain-containing protein [Cryobacterium roopkundense]|uniref:DUF1643 domain-containing protein n=1 Tax=Cryobacterium roopkundense TaxID=1001240 RepID=A0A7W9E4J9_9MICO|nr:DUF1643 domain-containing protein [Cryobacterium roopkundense]MBB5642757.1 hypothetical protein [Cryobacterium roopkundense]